MTKKVFTASPHSSLSEGYQLMKLHEIRHLPIVLSDHLLGMISEGDVLAKSEAEHGNIRIPNVTMGSIMKRKVITCTPLADLSCVAGLMITHGIKSVPVLHSNRIIGIITTTDLLDQFCIEEELCGQQVMPFSFKTRRYLPVHIT
jgi:CBS domain-containing protein